MKLKKMCDTIWARQMNLALIYCVKANSASNGIVIASDREKKCHSIFCLLSWDKSSINPKFCPMLTIISMIIYTVINHKVII